MAAPAVTPPVEAPASIQRRFAATLAGIRPVWSKPAALRAVRAAVVIPGLFALCSQVIMNTQMATFAAFGGFASLVLVSFGGNRRDRLVAHTGLAVGGSVLLVIGTAVSSSTVLAAVVTVPVVFVVLFLGAVSANAASGATAVLLAYVLPASTAGPVSTIPSRLAGWWLVSVVATASVLLLYSPPPVDRLRRAAAASARALGEELDAALSGDLTDERISVATQAKVGLLAASTEGPYRPTGITASDQAMAGLVEALQWSTSSIAEAVSDRWPCALASGLDRQRFTQSRDVLSLTAGFIDSGEESGLEQAVRDLDQALAAQSTAIDSQDNGAADQERVHRAFHSRMVGASARTVGIHTLIASRRIPPTAAAEEIGRWSGQPVVGDTGRWRLAAITPTWAALRGHTSLRSVWFLNATRGAVALAAAVVIADVTNVQHGFWVVLGALSVLRTNAASTGATALRALAGTVVGFFIGAALIVWIGSNSTALWAVLPVAVAVAAYAPGTAPFAVGQAAFTVLLSVLYNLIVPVGWKVGEIRVEDIALGAGISAVAGVLFWPRGSTRAAANDLADAFHAGGVYLVQASAWALGIRATWPDGGAVTAAGARLDAALRGTLTEQGTRRVPKDVMWRLAGGTLRLRLMTRALAAIPPPPRPLNVDDDRSTLADAVRVAGMYDNLAIRLGGLTQTTVAAELATLEDGEVAPDTAGPRVMWVHEYIEHLQQDVNQLAEPATVLSRRLTKPWWN